MLRATSILKHIEQLTRKMIEIGLSEDQNFPSKKEYSGKIEEIGVQTWNSDSSIFLKSIPYQEMYRTLCEQRIFNIKMIDGALIHMQYRFKNKKIENHRLSFFPAPNLEVFQNEPNIYIEDEIYNDILDKRIVTVPLRFDFDIREEVSSPIIHPVSHFTIGQYKNCRIPVSSALTPYQFLKFIIMNFYNTAYEKYSEKISIKKDCFDITIYPEEKEIINICTPVYRNK
mgnify:FL=1